MKSSDEQSTHIVALCISRIQEETEQRIYQALRAELQKHGYHLLIFNTFSDLDMRTPYDIGEQSIFSLIPYDRLEALILAAETLKQEEVIHQILSRAHAAAVPVITLDKPLEGCYNIGFSYAYSMEQIVRHIVEDHGCKRVNFIAGIKGNSFSEERLDAYKKVLTENGIPIDERRIGYGDFWEWPTYKAVEDFLESGAELPQAIICANDTMAIATCQKLEEKGFMVPEDIMVTGFDGIEAELFHTPRLTTAFMNITEAANVVVQLIKDISSGKKSEKEHIVQHKVVFSQSCGCRPKRVTNANEKVLGLYHKLARVHWFEQDMTLMVSSLSSSEDFSSAVSKFHTYLNLLDLDNVSIYIADNYLSPYVTKQNIGAFRPRSIPIVSKRWNNFIEQSEFETSALAPDFDNLIGNAEPLLFVPLHFQDIVLAYMVIGLPERFTDFNLLYIYCMHLNHTLGILQSQNSLRTALADLEEMYKRDYLTGLLNRRGFFAKIKPLVNQAIEENLFIVAFSIDLNGLKHINDTYGHQEGDFSIKTIANAMVSCAKPDTLVSRFGGDEFTVVGLSSAPKEESEAFQCHVQEYLDRINRTAGKPYEIAASFGISFCQPDDSFVLDELIKEADDRMYTEKEKSRYHRSGPR